MQNFVVIVFVIFRSHAIQLAQGPLVFEKKRKILDSLRFMNSVENNLKMSYHYLFEKWLEKQKIIVTVKMLGLKVDTNLV